MRQIPRGSPITCSFERLISTISGVYYMLPLSSLSVSVSWLLDLLKLVSWTIIETARYDLRGNWYFPDVD